MLWWDSKNCRRSLTFEACWLLLIPQDCETVAPVNMSPVRHLGNQGSDVKQVVDLEVAADHRGSILGDHPTRLQPPQKMFESKLLHQMRNFSVDRPVFIESESSLVGRRQVPAAMWKVNCLVRYNSALDTASCCVCKPALDIMLGHIMCVDAESRNQSQPSQTVAYCTIGSPIDALCKERPDSVLHGWYVSGSSKFTMCCACTFVLAPSMGLSPPTHELHCMLEVHCTKVA